MQKYPDGQSRCFWAGRVALFADTFMCSLGCFMVCGNWVRNREFRVVSCLGGEGLAGLEAQSSPFPPPSPI